MCTDVCTTHHSFITLLHMSRYYCDQFFQKSGSEKNRSRKHTKKTKENGEMVVKMVLASTQVLIHQQMLVI